MSDGLVRQPTSDARPWSGAPMPGTARARRVAAVLGSPFSAAALALAAFAASPLAPAAELHAQTATATLRGTVREPGGTPVADAQVEVRSLAAGVRRGALTNASGLYNVGGLQPGSYAVRVIRLGFTPVTDTVRLPVGEVVTRDFRFARAAAQQLTTVQVVESRAVDRTTSEVAANVSTEQIENLPQNNRNFLDFAALAPGVQRRDAGISAGGLSPNQANLFIDGASYKSDLLPGGIAGQDRGFATRDLRGVGQISGNPFPQNAVQEFRVVTQNYKAEYQRASGAVVTAATKSGTNDVSGDFFLYGQNRNLLATSYWDRRDNVERPEYQRAQFGGSLGGPIVRDRAHFFASYEGNLVDLNSRVIFRPPPALASQIPARLLEGAGQYDTPFQSNLFFGRGDYAISPTQSLVFTANIRRDKDTRGIGSPNGPESENNVRQQVDNYLLRHTLNRGAVTNELQVGFQRQDVSNRGVDATGVRQDFGGFGVVRGPFPSFQQFRQDKYTLRNDLQYALGTHVLKGGVIVEQLRYDMDKRDNEIPQFNYNPAGVNRGFGIDVPFEATLQIGSGIIQANNTQLGLYVQDDWTIAERLTLNLGVRWDYETNGLNNDFRTPDVVRTGVTQFLQTNPFFDGERYISDGASDRRRFTGAIQPRLGFSYDVTGTGRTVVYGGGGLFYDRIYANVLLDERLRTQRLAYRFTFRPAGNTDPALASAIPWQPSLLSRDALVNLVRSGAANTPEAFLVPDDLKPPRSQHLSLGLRQQVGSYQLSLTGTAVDGTNGFRYVWGQRDPRPGANFGAFRPVPGFGAILRATDAGRTWYRALLVQASRPLLEGRRWGGDVSYTLSESETNTVNGDDAFALDYVNESEFRRIRSPWDERHRIALNLVTRLPLGIRASTLTQLGSGVAYLTSTNCDATQAQLTEALARAPNDERLRFCQANRFFGNGNGMDWDDQPPGKTGVWGSAPQGRWFGPFGRWAFRQVDLRLQKDVPVVRGQQASLFFDVYNVFNFDNFNYQDFRYSAFFDREREPIPFRTFDARRAQLGLRYSF